MRRYVGCLLLLTLLVTSSLGQGDELTTEQLQRMYDDAIAQLRAVQDRRNELARENEQLQEQVARLERQVADAQAQFARLTDSTYRIRSERAAWLDFLRMHPVIRSQWFSFLNKSGLATEPSRYLDPQWPLYR